MKLGKKILAMSLAASMVTTPAAVMAEKIDSKEGKNVEIAEHEENGDYTEFIGEIKSLNLEEGKGSILVKGEKEDMIFHINDKVLVTDMRPTKENKIMNLKEGARVRVFYPSNTPVALSLPAQLTPEVVVVENGDMQVKVDNFNENLVSSDGKLKLNIEEEDQAREYSDKKLLVFYSSSTKSIPAQTNPDMVTILEEDRDQEEEIKGDYKRYDGKISSRNKNEETDSITVKTNDEEIIFHISEETLVTDMRSTFENKMMHLKEDQEVIIFTKSTNPMTASIPPQTTPDVIIIKNDDKLVKVDKFDENLISSDNMLELNVEDSKKREDLKNKNLLVFYEESTKSIPALTTPLSILSLDVEKIEKPQEEKDITVLDKIKINGKDINIKMYKKSDGTVMLPVRKLADSLSYDLKWTSNNDPIELSKNAHWTSFKIGVNQYSFAKKTPFKLSSAPELKNGKTYIPSDFIKEVLMVENIKIVDGMINIK